MLYHIDIPEDLSQAVRDRILEAINAVYASNPEFTRSVTQRMLVLALLRVGLAQPVSTLVPHILAERRVDGRTALKEQRYQARRRATIMVLSWRDAQALSKEDLALWMELHKDDKPHQGRSHKATKSQGKDPSPK